MPSTHVALGQDWGTVNVGKSSVTSKTVVPKSAKDIARAKQLGLVASEKRLAIFILNFNKSKSTALIKILTDYYHSSPYA